MSALYKREGTDRDDPLQLVPCEFQYAVKSLGRLLEPTSTSLDVSTASDACEAAADAAVVLAKLLICRTVPAERGPMLVALRVL